MLLGEKMLALSNGEQGLARVATWHGHTRRIHQSRLLRLLVSINLTHARRAKASLHLRSSFVLVSLTIVPLVLLMLIEGTFRSVGLATSTYESSIYLIGCSTHSLLRLAAFSGGLESFIGV